MKWFWTQYHPRFIRSLVYLLQASEYDVRAAVQWYMRVSDFRTVEFRKQIDWTRTAVALYAIGWIVVFVVGGISLAVHPVALLALPFVTVALFFVLVAAVRSSTKKPLEWLALKRIQRGLAQHAGARIAIAGSFGKTTMREIVKGALSAGKKVAAVPENHNTPAGIARFVRALTGDEDVLIFECGEYYPGDIRALARVVRPQWGIITGVNEAHLEKFKSLEATAATIFELSEYVAPDHLYVNGDNAIARDRAVAGNNVYTSRGTERWKSRDMKTDIEGTSGMFVSGAGQVPIQTSLIGLHLVGPLAAAVDVADRLGLSPDVIATGISTLRPFSHRMEVRQLEAGVTLIDDSYNGNSDGVRAGISFLATLPGCRTYITPGLVEAADRVGSVHREIGRLLAASAIERVVLIRTSVAQYIEAGLIEGNFRGALQYYDSMPAALAAVPHLVLPGDTVMIQNDWPDQYA